MAKLFLIAILQNIFIFPAFGSISDLNAPPEFMPSAGTFSQGTLNSNQTISLQGNLVLTMQEAGNLVLMSGGKAIWYSSGSGPNGQPCPTRNNVSQCKAVFQPQGNIVLYNGSSPYWYTSTGSSGGSGYGFKISSSYPYLAILNSQGVQYWPYAAQPVQEPQSGYAVRGPLAGSNGLFLGYSSSGSGAKFKSKLSRFSFDWNSKTFTFVSDLFDPFNSTAGFGKPVVFDGGFAVSQAIDPVSEIIDNETWVAFECVVTRNSLNLSSSCLAPLTATGLDTSRASVPVQESGPSTASVPKLVNLNGKIYLYWTKVERDQSYLTTTDESSWLNLSVRGIQLSKDRSGRLYPVDSSGNLIQGGIPANDPRSVEVFAPVANDPNSNIVADAFHAIAMGDFIYMTTATGGQDSQGKKCLWTNSNFSVGYGCYRMNIRRTKSPLQYHAFMSESVAESLLPLTAASYSYLVKSPSGEYQILASYLKDPKLISQSQQVPSGISLINLPMSLALLDSSFLSASFPTTLNPADKGISGSITMKNNGLVPWSFSLANPISLGATSFGNNWNIDRISLDKNERVMPGAVKTFKVVGAVAPAKSGLYGFHWQMVDDGVAWFGQASTPKEVIIGNAVTSSGSWGNNSSFSGNYAFDGNLSSRWASNYLNNSPSYIQVDFGSNKLVTGLDIYWETAGSYQIQVSFDGSKFYTAFSGIAFSNSHTYNDLSQTIYRGWGARFIRISPATTTESQYRSVYEISIKRQ